MQTLNNTSRSCSGSIGRTVWRETTLAPSYRIMNPTNRLILLRINLKDSCLSWKWNHWRAVKRWLVMVFRQSSICEGNLSVDTASTLAQRGELCWTIQEQQYASSVRACTRSHQCFCFQIYVNYFSDTLILKMFFYIMKRIYYRGDLTGISAKKHWFTQGS